jgi:DNA-binding transcriptional regulator YdaS (Cro superfamily)
MLLAMCPRLSDDKYKEEFAEKLRALAPYLNVSQLAREIEVSPSTISQFMRNPAKLSAENVQHLERLLDEKLAPVLPRKEAQEYAVISIACPVCKQTVPFRFSGNPMFVCGICGNEFGLVCRCGHPNRMSAKYCESCRAPLTEEAAKAADMALEVVEEAMANTEPPRSKRERQPSRHRPPKRPKDDINY